LHDSRFTIGRRSDAANDRIIRNLKVKGGRIRKIGDKWTIEPVVKTYREKDEGDCPDITVVSENPIAAGDTVSVVTGIEPDGHELTLKRQTITISHDPDPGSGLPTGTADHMILRWNATTSAWEQIGGYEEVEVVLYTRGGVLNGTILFKPAAEGGYTGYSSSQDRLLLQVVEQSTETVLVLDHGHLADGGT
jgi:hypothetical protein